MRFTKSKMRPDQYLNWANLNNLLRKSKLLSNFTNFWKILSVTWCSIMGSLRIRLSHQFKNWIRWNWRKSIINKLWLSLFYLNLLSLSRNCHHRRCLMLKSLKNRKINCWKISNKESDHFNISKNTIKSIEISISIIEVKKDAVECKQLTWTRF